MNKRLGDWKEGVTKRLTKDKYVKGWDFPSLFVGELLIIGLSYLCYDHLFWSLFLQPLLIPYFFYLRTSRRKRQMRQYEKGFYDFLQSILPSIQAGYSLENACLTAYEELLQLYGKENAFVIQLARVARGIEVHVPLEELIHELAERTENEDIRQFSTILEILKNMGGNSVEILRNSMIRIQKKMDTREEIRTTLSGKIYEKNLMLVMPFLMILYLKITNGNYLNLIYHTLPGQCVMTVCLLGILACFYWTEHIMNCSSASDV
ncbi:MAG: hypothetical protein Q4E53_14000 [Eubacteriales bacterium]|nr:hypothetical protein [Eubacteriales bacterium]